ncbi:MAG: hypothetical protein JJU05_02990 [Verrucomicrobia bacterium]|nr:hypothetical protein [Verrucomicrobiota bacterium]MCH8527715.1 hypothetical protein [Kiritimatiellia bacterium]
MTTSPQPNLHESVQEYYGEILRGSADLKTNACTCSGDRTRHFGLFPCEHPQDTAPKPASGSCC